MGGIKTAGDLVFRMQLMYGMRINEAKKAVADQLGITVEQLGDIDFMSGFRADRGFGVCMPKAGDPTGVAAKIRIEKAMDIKINSVRVWKEKAGLSD